MLFPVVATIIEITTDDDYYLAIRSEPPTFAHYRQVRIERSNDEWRKRTLEAAYDSYLKKKLREPPEKRYLREKGNWLFHDSSYPMRGLERYDGEGLMGLLVAFQSVDIIQIKEGLKMRKSYKNIKN